MFHSNEEKISLARAILRDNKGTPEHFLSKCREAGIMHGNRDTQDELWEFEEYVLKYVPGSIHSLKESLLAELDTKCLEVCRDIYSDREVGLVLEALIRNGDWRTAAAVGKSERPTRTRWCKEPIRKFAKLSTAINHLNRCCFVLHYSVLS